MTTPSLKCVKCVNPCQWYPYYLRTAGCLVYPCDLSVPTVAPPKKKALLDHFDKVLPSRKPTWQWKINQVTCHLKMYFLLNMAICYCKILSLLECSSIRCPSLLSSLRAQKIWQLMPFLVKHRLQFQEVLPFLPPPKKKTWLRGTNDGNHESSSVCFKAVPVASGATPFRQLVTSVPPATGSSPKSCPATIMWFTSIYQVSGSWSTPSFGSEGARREPNKIQPTMVIIAGLLSLSLIANHYQRTTVFQDMMIPLWCEVSYLIHMAGEWGHPDLYICIIETIANLTCTQYVHTSSTM